MYPKKNNCSASPRAQCLQRVHAWSRKWQKSFSILFLISLAFFGISFFVQHRLPAPEMLQKEIVNKPIQTEIEEENFDFEYRGKNYDVQPVAEYEMWGLVVSHNNIHSIADIYHDKDSVDLKDICVIWGKNTASDYRDVKFWSNAWTCWWQHDGGTSFVHRDVSNNHFLAAEKTVQEKIKNVRIGDQIHIQGKLVNYTDPKKNFTRTSSTTRDDTGNGACEVVFVEEIEVLQRGEALWQDAHDYAFWGMMISAVCKFLLIFVRIQREKRCVE